MWRKKVFRHVFRIHGLLESFRIAFKGIWYMFLYHRNMRIIFLIGLAAFLTGIYFQLKGIEFMILCITITAVFMAEMFNTAIEMVTNMVAHKFHLRVKVIKDIAAAVVLIASLNAVAVGYALFWKRLFK
jgi:diacylglycerol kinase